MENFLKDIPSKSPYLVHVEGDTADSATQMFVILEQDVLCEWIKHPDYSLPLSSLVTLVAVYCIFNLRVWRWTQTSLQIVRRTYFCRDAKTQDLSLKTVVEQTTIKTEQPK